MALDYMDRLRRLAINDAHSMEDVGGDVASGDLDPKTLALVRLAALVAVGGAVPSYGAQADSAVSAGATAAEIVDVLVSVIPVVGLPSVVAAAPKLALGLGHDLDEALEISLESDVGYSPSRPTAIASRTASPREDTPSFR